MVQSAWICNPRLIVQRSEEETEATVTLAPNRVNVSVMHEVSISSEPSAMGTSTVFVVDMARRVEVVVNDDDEEKVVTTKEDGSRRLPLRNDGAKDAALLVRIGQQEEEAVVAQQRTQVRFQRNIRKTGQRTNPTSIPPPSPPPPLARTEAER